MFDSLITALLFKVEPCGRVSFTFVGGLRQCGMTAPFVLEGTMNGPMFLAHVKQCLVPTLKRRAAVSALSLPPTCGTCYFVPNICSLLLCLAPPSLRPPPGSELPADRLRAF